MSPNDDAGHYVAPSTGVITSGNSSDDASQGGSVSQSNNPTSSCAGTILSNFSAGMQTLAKGLFPGSRYIQLPEKNEQPSKLVPLLQHKDLVQTLQQIIRSNAGGAQFVSKENQVTNYRRACLQIGNREKGKDSYPVALFPDLEGKPSAWNDEGYIWITQQVFSSIHELEPQFAFLLDVCGREIVVDFYSRVKDWQLNETCELLFNVDFHSIESCQILSPPN